MDRARKTEEQGRLFWVWLLTLPILLMMGASQAFGAPWPSPLLFDLAMVTLAFPVLFVAGEPLFGDALEARRQSKWSLEMWVAGLVMAGYASGLLALISPAPQLAGASAVAAAAYLTVRYLKSVRTNP